MALIRLVRASKDFGIKTLFEDLDLFIEMNERLGLIGKNGSGKSTLLKVIAGEEPLGKGERSCSSKLNITLSSQSKSYEHNATVLEEVLKGCGKKKELLIKFNSITTELAKSPYDQKLLQRLSYTSELMDAEEAWNLEQKCKEVLNNLGIKELNKPLKELSGGYRARVNLASALVSKPDVLLLDEPTNHLDAVAIEWLQNYLKTYKGALVLVTHDRYFLDKVTKRIIEIENGKVNSYAGNYTIYLKQKLNEENSEANSKKKFQTILRKEIDWLKRGPKARSTKQKARLQRIEKMKEEQPIIENSHLKMDSTSRRIGKIVIEAENLEYTKNTGEFQQMLIKDFSYSFTPNDRVGIIGGNGTGKTTLLNLLAKKENPSKGTLMIGETVNLGYLDQQTDELIQGKGVERKVIEYVEEAASRIEIESKQISASQLLERFLFPPGQQHLPLSKLSGGEKRRLTLCRILMQAPNVLLLDEPTNDLDIQTLSVLEDFIENFKGCVIVVSHDRYFLDRTVDRIFKFNNGNLIRFEGNYSEYLEKEFSLKVKEQNSSKSIADKFKKGEAKETKNSLNKNIKVRDDKKTKKPRRISFKESKELECINTELPKLEKEKELIEIDISKGAGDLIVLSQKLALLIKNIQTLEDRWIDLSDLDS